MQLGNVELSWGTSFLWGKALDRFPPRGSAKESFCTLPRCGSRQKAACMQLASQSLARSDFKNKSARFSRKSRSKYVGGAHEIGHKNIQEIV